MIKKVASSNSGRSGRKFFCSPKLTLRADFSSVFVPPPMLPQGRVKDPGHSAKSAGGRIHLNTHTPLTQRSRSGLTMPLSRHNVGTYKETGSHATRQGTLSHSRLSSPNHCRLILVERVQLSVRELISTKKKKKGREKKRRRGMNCRTFSQNPRTRGKRHHLGKNGLSQNDWTPVIATMVAMVSQQT